MSYCLIRFFAYFSYAAELRDADVDEEVVDELVVGEVRPLPRERLLELLLERLLERLLESPLELLLERPFESVPLPRRRDLLLLDCVLSLCLFCSCSRK